MIYNVLGVHAAASEAGAIGLSDLSVDEESYKIRLSCGTEAHQVDSSNPDTLQVLTAASQDDLLTLVLTHDDEAWYRDAMSVKVETAIRAREAAAATPSNMLKGSQVPKSSRAIIIKSFGSPGTGFQHSFYVYALERTVAGINLHSEFDRLRLAKEKVDYEAVLFGINDWSIRLQWKGADGQTERSR